MLKYLLDHSVRLLGSPGLVQRLKALTLTVEKAPGAYLCLWGVRGCILQSFSRYFGPGAPNRARTGFPLLFGPKAGAV